VGVTDWGSTFAPIPQNEDGEHAETMILSRGAGADVDYGMSPATILIVDDDDETRLLLGEELRDLGHKSLYAADGVQALSMVRRERPDLILLDLRLPGGDGFMVLERLRRIPEVAFTPVIVFSGMRSPDAEERALMLGAREFIHKSFSGGNDLTAAIRRALQRGPAADPALASSGG
jgi:CheY-like chemotaxis protein